MTDDRIFTLTLVAKDADQDPIHGLRALLKLALRRHGLRCTQIRELTHKVGPSPNSAAPVENHNDGLTT